MRFKCAAVFDDKYTAFGDTKIRKFHVCVAFDVEHPAAINVDIA